MSHIFQGNHYDLLSNFNPPPTKHDEYLPNASVSSIERKLYGNSLVRRESLSSESKGNGKNSLNLNGSFCKYRIFNLTSPYRDPYL